MVPEAEFERAEHGLTPGGRGWFVLNAQDARWPDPGPVRYDGRLPG